MKNECDEVIPRSFGLANRVLSSRTNRRKKLSLHFTHTYKKILHIQSLIRCGSRILSQLYHQTSMHMNEKKDELDV